jgi:hypothetical protein
MSTQKRGGDTENGNQRVILIRQDCIIAVMGTREGRDTYTFIVISYARFVPNCVMRFVVLLAFPFAHVEFYVTVGLDLWLVIPKDLLVIGDLYVMNERRLHGLDEHGYLLVRSDASPHHFSLLPDPSSLVNSLDACLPGVKEFHSYPISRHREDLTQMSWLYLIIGCFSILHIVCYNYINHFLSSFWYSHATKQLDPILVIHNLPQHVVCLQP